MLLSKIKLPLLLLTIFFIFQSCNEDDSIAEIEEVVNEENEDKIQDVATLDNDIVVSWMNLFLELERYADGMRPNVSARAIAYINLAAYETAVPGMSEYKSCDGKISNFNLRTSLDKDNIDFNIALNACFAKVLDHFIVNIPDNLRSNISDLESQNETVFNVDLSSNDLQESIEWGESIAEAVIDYSQTDTRAEEQALDPQPTSYVPPTGEGFWVFTAEPERALFPYWGSARTFVVDVDETTTVAPIAYSENSNSAYFKEMIEVYEINNTAREEDNEQLWIAEFWGDDVTGLTFGPPSRQISIANQLVAQFDTNLEETLHMYLKLGFALNDAAVSAWEYKYEHMVQRPSAFIHEFLDPNYETNLFRLIPWPNPSFPGYPSGHSTFASAAAGVFIDFYGDSVTFTDNSHLGRTEFKSEPRTYSTLSDMAAENAFSRIPLGVHIRMDCVEGLRLGYEISGGVNELDLTAN